MTGVDFVAILPLLVTAYAGVALMVIVAFWRSHTAAFVLTLASLAAAFGSIFLALPYAPRAVTPLIEVDHYSLYFTGLILAGALLVTLLCRDYLQAREKRSEAFYVLLMLAVLGMETIASSAHFASFFLGLETLSVSLYGLIGYTREHKLSLEGAIKYLVLAATASAFLLFGIALVYADTGTMDLRHLVPLMASHKASLTLSFGLALILVAFGFKLAFVPFHMWSPDVYQGAPAPITGLIATGSKGAVFALLLRLVTITSLGSHREIFLVGTVLAVATMSVGNLLALLQTNVKRLLAYSSIAHMGYLLIPLLAGGTRGPSSIAFYLASYFATTIAAFGVVAVLSGSRLMGDTEELEDYRGLSLRHPLLAAVFALALLSLTGMPLTAGFIAKFYIFAAAAEAKLWGLLIVGIVNSGISAFYYLRVVVAMYSRADAEPAALPKARAASALCLAVCAAVVLFFGIYPAPLIQLSQAATRLLGF